jgi:uncharacterized delta-60 repeat protein
VLRRTRLVVAVLAGLVALAAPSGQAWAAGGDLDPSFGAGGATLTSFGGPAMAYAQAVEPDGSIVAAGFAAVNGDYDFALARYTPDGRLDPSFGTGGRVTTDFGGYEVARALVIQRDGKLVLAGEAAGSGFALARYTPDGRLDPSFGTGGRVLTGGTGAAYGVAIQPDGAIVAAGYTDGPTGTDFAVTRYTADGALDPSFGTDGRVVTDLGGADHIAAIAVQRNGAVVVAGDSDGDFALARYGRDGAPDPSFGTGGTVRTDLGGTDAARALAIEPRGAIVAAGSSNGPAGRDSDFALVRYRADGTPDPGFGTGGTVRTGFGSASSDVALAVAVAPDGQLVAAGTASSKVALARYDRSGHLDTAFGSGGTVVTDVGHGADAAAFAVTLQPRGRITVSGYAGRASFLTARYLLT